MVHIGENIHWLLKKREIKVNKLASHLKFSETNLFNIFKKNSIDALLLKKIADFFHEPVWVFYEENIQNFVGDKVSENKADYKRVPPEEVDMLKKEIQSLTTLLRDKDERIAYLQRRQ